jgi:glycosyltransferase involved in cell wall biosynthesis
LFVNYWGKKIDSEFRQLLDRIDLFLSISEAMSSEYKKRYNRLFKPFHNPIDISKFNNRTREKSEEDKTFRIVYLGRIGVANKHSIHSFANAVSKLQLDAIKVMLDIYSTGVEYSDSRKIDKLKNIRILPPVRHEMVPALLSEYDLLLLPLDFTRSGFKYAQYSIPTKASEYMMSGTPIIVFAPKETAISRFCSDHECGYCITDNSEKSVSDAIEFLVINKVHREKISSNAVRLAAQLFDANKVRNEFQQLLINTSKSNVHR